MDMRTPGRKELKTTQWMPQAAKLQRLQALCVFWMRYVQVTGRMYELSSDQTTQDQLVGATKLPRYCSMVSITSNDNFEPGTLSEQPLYPSPRPY
ncbi:hypothetical protein R6Q59_011149 [Mikania micrantha]